MASSFLKDKLKSLKSRSSKHNDGKKKSSSVDSNGEVIITVDSQTNHPTLAWDRLKESHKTQQLDPDTYRMRPREDNVLRFVCMSDTHGTVEQSRREFHKRVPDGDVLIHCGDFSMGGDASEIKAFDSFIARLPHPVKLVIAGNHELTFEDASYGVHPVLIRQQLGMSLNATSWEVVVGCKALLEHAMYLEDESINLCGINIYASPWVPSFGCWGFSASRGDKLLEKWNQIPSTTDILITHGPPCGYGDAFGPNRAGCVELLNTVVKRVKPKFHAFGHIHSGYGMWTNGTTTFINSAVCSNKYKPDHDPIVFDYPLPSGYSRQDFIRLSTESLRQARNTATQQHKQQNGYGNSDCSSANEEPVLHRTSHGAEKQSRCGAKNQSYQAERQSHGAERQSQGAERQSQGAENQSYGAERQSHGATDTKQLKSA
ncbi:hypothetical protein ACOMHN_047943 [Nucella lapillus]